MFWWQSRGGSLLLLGQDEPAASPTLDSETTAAALARGYGSFKLTAVIEGCPYILSDAAAQLAVDAWYGATTTHHRTQALGDCLFVTGDQSQQILDWRNPFPRGGTIMLHVAPDSAGTFRKHAFRRKTSVRTEMDETVDCDDTTITVKSTSTFDSSGDAFVGTECIGYAGTTGTTLTGCTRGKYPALARGGTGGDGFGHHHRVGNNDLEVKLNPLVTEVPRRWEGKWVSLYLHKYDVANQRLNAKADALRLFAGKVVSLVDDPATGCTVIEVKHALDVIVEHTVGGRDQWSGTIRNTIFLQTGMTFQMKDIIVDTTPTIKNADDMVVGGANSFDPAEGYYEIEEVYGILNTWWADQNANSNLSGVYTIGFTQTDPLRSTIGWSIAGADGQKFELKMPRLVSARLGYVFEGQEIVNGFSQSTITADETDDDLHAKTSEDELQRVIVNNALNATGAIIEDEQGIFSDQYSFLPAADKPSATADEGYGIFLVDEQVMVLASYDHDGGPNGEPILNNLKPLTYQFGLPDVNLGNFWRLPLRQNGPRDTSIRQIFVLEGGLADLLLRIFYSTGTTGHNHATYDTLAYGLGVGIPGEILGNGELVAVDNDFIKSVNALPSADAPIALLIDKQIKLSTLIAGELIVRRSFLRWNTGTGCLELVTWKTPTENNSVATLTEANKASPSGTEDHHRSVTAEDMSWSVPTANIRFNRSLKGDPAGNDQYRDTLTIADKAALDDAGGDGPSINIDCRGTFGDFMQTGQTADSLSATFMATMPYFSQPALRMSRSINQLLYTTLSIGDVVLVNDDYAINPDTGNRGLTRYGIIIRHRFSIGGFTADSDSAQPQGGEVDVFFVEGDDVAAYVPSAQVDDTQTNGGYTDATKTLICYAHQYSHSDEPADASRFDSGYKIRIVEIDPDDPAAPDSWERTINNVLGNSIVLTTALSSPAWDSSKKYRIVFQDYDDCQPAQQVKTFQADGTDGMIQDLRAPFQYGAGGADGSFALWSATHPVELPPDVSYGDGRGRDVGHEVALARLLNNLVMFKTGVSSPCLSSSVLSFGIIGGLKTWRLVQCRPVHLGDDILGGFIYREVNVAPHFRSDDGSSASVRVTLSRTPPTSSSYYDVNRGSVFSSVTFTTTSTTFATPTPESLSATAKASDGIAWVYVEVSDHAETWGLAHLQETSIRNLFQLPDLEPA